MADKFDELLDAVINLQKNTVRQVLNQNQHAPSDLSNILHSLLQDVTSTKLCTYSHRRTLMYMLLCAGADVHYTNQGGNTALHLCLLHHGGDSEIMEPMLQYGADINKCNDEEQTACTLVKQASAASNKLLAQYTPGIWHAVASDNLLDVRKLVNLWCTVDIAKNDKTLVQMTFDKGTECIIRLVKDISPSMKIAHYVLAEDIDGVKKVLAEKQTYNLNFRNLGDMGATPLFYAIHQNHSELVKLLVNHGANINSEITLQEEDIPLIFTSLNSETDVDIIRTLVLPRETSTLNMSALFYQGRHVLEQCIVAGVNINAAKHILKMGHHELLTLRNVHNEDARMVAVRLKKQPYVDLIDEIIYDWYLDVSNQHRKALALKGYSSFMCAAKDGARACDVVHTMETSSPQALFDTQLKNYQDQISALMSAIFDHQMEHLPQLFYFTSDKLNCFHTCIANAMPLHDGQPLLHKAVLLGRLAMVQRIVEVLHKEHIELDSIRDQWHRTALHYAYAVTNGDKVVDALLDHGASEFTMDQDSRSPLVFRDHQRHPNMSKLLAWHRKPNYAENEPDPWSVKMPPKNKGEILNHHRHHPHNHQPHFSPPGVRGNIYPPTTPPPAHSAMTVAKQSWWGCVII